MASSHQIFCPVLIDLHSLVPECLPVLLHPVGAGPAIMPHSQCISPLSSRSSLLFVAQPHCRAGGREAACRGGGGQGLLPRGRRLGDKNIILCYYALCGLLQTSKVIFEFISCIYLGLFGVDCEINKSEIDGGQAEQAQGDEDGVNKWGVNL